MAPSNPGRPGNPSIPGGPGKPMIDFKCVITNLKQLLAKLIIFLVKSYCIWDFKDNKN